MPTRTTSRDLRASRGLYWYYGFLWGNEHLYQFLQDTNQNSIKPFLGLMTLYVP